MANYDESKLTKLGHLKDLAEKIKSGYTTKTEFSNLSSKVDGLVSTGGEPNVIEKIKVNGADQAVTDKAVDISVPTKVSELNNDSKFQKDTEVQAAIQEAISASGHAKFEKADTVPDAASAVENVLYLVMNSKTKHYDIYAKIGAEVVLLDDTTVDLSGYVVKEAGKGLSSNDYTDAEKTKLAGLENYTHPSHTAKASGLYKVTVDALGHITAANAVVKADITGLGIPGQDTTYTDATTSAAGLMSAADKTKLDGISIAADAEVSSMLDEVFAV